MPRKAKSRKTEGGHRLANSRRVLRALRALFKITVFLSQRGEAKAENSGRQGERSADSIGDVGELDLELQQRLRSRVASPRR